MYQIMLVDDDSFFASIFRNGFDWEEEGFAIACHAENGQRAIDQLHQYPIDLAFVDMCMPGMNGAELIAYIASEFPHVACVALSSYDDFDFVKESFRAGAIDYILKHCLNRVEIMRILTAFREKKGLSKKSGSMASLSMDMFPTATCRYFSALFLGKYIQVDNDFLLPDSIGIPHIASNILLAKTVISQYNSFCKKYLGMNKLPFIIRSICSILQNITDRHTVGVVFYHPDDQCFYTVMSDDRFTDDQFYAYTKDLFQQQGQNSLQRYFNVGSEITISPLCKSIQDIHFTYAKLNSLRVANEKAQPWLMQGTDNQALYEHSLYAIKRYMTYWESRHLRRYIASVYQGAQDAEAPLTDFVGITVMLGRIYRECCTYFQAAGMPQPDFIKLINFRSSAEMENYCLSLFETLFNHLYQQNANSLSAHVQNALRLIQDQLHLTTMSLSLIATKLHINPSYLSRVFNSEMNIGITEYINRHRVQHAADLLLIEHISVKDAAERCGFENYTYFFRVFKKYMGSTPMQYSNQGVHKHSLD